MKFMTMMHTNTNHADCGMTHLTDEGIRQEAKSRTPDATKEINATKSYGCFDESDFEKAIRDDVTTLRQSKVLAGVDIRGLAMDTVTGVVTELKT